MAAENPSITFLWKIENFYYCPQCNGEILESPEFYVNALSESSWKLCIYPCRLEDEDEDEMKVILHNNYYNVNSTLFIDYEISFLSVDSSSVLVTSKERNQKINADTSYEISTGITYNEVYKSKKEEFLPQDTLTIQCRIWKTRKSLTHSLHYFARTRIGIQSRSFHWAVAEFSQMKFNRKKMYRITAGKDQPTFYIELFLKGAPARRESVGIDIRQITMHVPKLYSTWKISVLDVTGNIVKSEADDFWLSPGDSAYSFPRFLKTKHLTSRKTEWLVGDVLNLLFNFTFSTDVEYSNIESVLSLPSWIRDTIDDNSNMEEVAQGASLDNVQGSDQSVFSVNNVSDQSSDESMAILQMDLLSLYKDKTLSDFDLRIGIDFFPVHKSVLVARSPFFKAMFSSDMKEGTADFLDISDMDVDTLDRLLMYIYTGTAANLDWECACKLFYAVDTYKILSLKKKCSAFLASNIADSNVCEALLLAGRHNDEELKSSVHDFIVLNDYKIIRSTEWKRFLVSNPLLAAETMQMLYVKKLDQQTIIVFNVNDQTSDASLAVLQMDLLSLYKDKTLSDFELRIGSESFPVHKSVLVARSPVFKAMFLSGMKEGTVDFLDIPDVDAGALDRLLMYVYTGTAADLDRECACKLYYAADKYEILSLKQKCSAFLASNIADSNVCEILLLANRHNDEELKSLVNDFIVLNDSKIIQSTAWKQFLVSNPILATETMQLLYLKKLDMQENVVFATHFYPFSFTRN